MPKHAQGPVTPHTIVTLPNTNGMQLLLCYDNEGVYVNTYGKVSAQSREWSGQSLLTGHTVILPGQACQTRNRSQVRAEQSGKTPI